jgi:2-polyprenyl-6-methoxyphenol hydroxylase-like FAD-dependent oxidoreductase
MSLHDRHVVVVGAGIGGAAAALLLARTGARVTLLETAAEPRAVGAGILLQPNGLAVLYGLDLDERLPRRGCRLSSLRVADAAGRTILEAPVPRFAAGLDHALVLRRSDLLAALVDLVVAEPGVECRFGTDVIDAAPDGSVEYRTLDAKRTIAADLVVGADGVHSTIRKRGRFAPHVGRSLRYVRGIGPPLQLDGATEYWTELGIFGLAPVEHGTYFYASTQDGPLADSIFERDVGLFRETWSRVLPPAGQVLTGARFEDLLINEVIRVDCARWTDGHLVLLGDAAHAMAPNLGQGAGSALVDATVLAWELAQPGEPAAALARYDARRRPAVRVVQDIAGRLAWLSDVPNPVLRFVRDGVLRLCGSWLAGQVGNRLVEQEDPLWLRMAAAAPADAEEA